MGNTGLDESQSESVQSENEAKTVELIEQKESTSGDTEATSCDASSTEPPKDNEPLDLTVVKDVCTNEPLDLTIKNLHNVFIDLTKIED